MPFDIYKQKFFSVNQSHFMAQNSSRFAENINKCPLIFSNTIKHGNKSQNGAS